VKKESLILYLKLAFSCLTRAVFLQAVFQVAKQVTAGNLGKQLKADSLVCERRRIFGSQAIGLPTSLNLSESTIVVMKFHHPATSLISFKGLMFKI